MIKVFQENLQSCEHDDVLEWVRHPEPGLVPEVDVVHRPRHRAHEEGAAVDLLLEDEERGVGHVEQRVDVGPVGHPHDKDGSGPRDWAFK